MIIFITRLELKNFKGHKELEFDLAENVKIVGKNGEGKSSIGEAVTWCLYGTDTLGNLFDPTPLFDFEGNVMVSVFLKIDEKTIKLTRAIEEGKNTFHLNDVPTKAMEYKEVVEELVDKNLFLSIFNPNYFSSQHWKDQRAQLLKYIEEPLNKDVLDQMQNIHKVTLEEPLKKHSLNELDKLHKDRFKKRDKEIERASARVQTLREQYEKALGTNNVDLSQIEAAMRELEKEWNEAILYNEKIKETQQKVFELHAKVDILRNEILKKKEEVEKIKEEPIPDTCYTCGQELDFNARKTHNQSHLQRLEKAKLEGKELVADLKKVQEQVAELGVVEKPMDITELQKKLANYRYVLMDSDRIKELYEDLEKAKDEYDLIRAERNESQSIIDAIKLFVDVKAEMMAKSVNELFDKLQVRLFEKQKNESVKQTFEIIMNHKPYQKLSTAEKIRCGLEIITVLQRQSGVTAPTFVDNAESILNIDPTPGQFITATVRNQKLKIEGGTTA